MENVQNTSLKVFFACAFGALVGTVTALQFSPLWWWVGLLVGGFTGYLSYEIKNVGRALVKAWNKVVQWRIPKTRKGFKKKMMFLTTGIVSSYSLLFPYLLLESFSLNSRDLFESVLFFVVMSFLFLSIVCVVLLIEVLDTKKRFSAEYFSEEQYQEEKKRMFFVLKYLNPILFCFTAIFWFGKIIVKNRKEILYFFMEVLGLIRIILKFFFVTLWIKLFLIMKKTFILIHSDVRVICFIDAFIGGAIGLYFQNPLIGCLAGGVIGWFNYQIVSIRILKIVPKNS